MSVGVEFVGVAVSAAVGFDDDLPVRGGRDSQHSGVGVAGMFGQGLAAGVEVASAQLEQSGDAESGHRSFSARCWVSL